MPFWHLNFYLRFFLSMLVPNFYLTILVLRFFPGARSSTSPIFCVCSRNKYLESNLVTLRILPENSFSEWREVSSIYSLVNESIVWNTVKLLSGNVLKGYEYDMKVLLQYEFWLGLFSWLFSFWIWIFDPDFFLGAVTQFLFNDSWLSFFPGTRSVLLKYFESALGTNIQSEL